MTEVLAYSEQLENEVSELAETTSLPKRPRYDEVQTLVKSLLKDYMGTLSK